MSDALPRWNTENIYSSLEGADYRAAFGELEGLLAESESFADRHGMRRGDLTQVPDARLIEALLGFIERANRWGRLWGTLRPFVYAFVSTDSYNALALREQSKLDLLGTRARK